MRLFDRPGPVFAVAIVAALTGCASKPNERATADLSPEQAAVALESRTLRDPGLHRYLAANAGHDPGDAWDFESLCWAAFYFNPSLAVARAQWDTAVAAQRTAAQRPNPTLTLTPGYDFTREAGVSPWMPSIGLDFLVATRGRRSWQQEIAAADADAARLAVYAAVWQVRSDLRKALLESEIASRRANVLRQQSDAQQRLVSLLQQRFEAGAIAQSEILVTRTAWLRAEAAAADAAVQADAARIRVAAALGVPAAALIHVRLPAVPPPPHWTDAELTTARRAALLSRADVLAALAKYRAADAALGLELARRMPEIHLGPAYQYDQGQNKWSLGISFELPVFNRHEGPIAEASARRAEAAAQFNLVQTQALVAVDRAAAALRAAERQLQRAAQIEDQTRAQSASVQQRLRAGGADQVELETAAVDAANSAGMALDAEAAVSAAAGQLEDALQTPFPHIAAVAKTTQTPQP
jgi:outer membrane protein TolC